MPTYDYCCDACGHQFELFQSITANPIKKCPACKKSKARRLIGAGASIIFRGSGFYQTDYRSDNYKKAAKADADAAGGTKSEKSEKADQPAAAAGDARPASGGKSGSTGKTGGSTD